MVIINSLVMLVYQT